MPEARSGSIAPGRGAVPLPPLPGEGEAPALRRGGSALALVWLLGTATVYFATYLWNAAVHWAKIPDLLRSLSGP